MNWTTTDISISVRKLISTWLSILTVITLSGQSYNWKAITPQIPFHLFLGNSKTSTIVSKTAGLSVTETEILKFSIYLRVEPQASTSSISGRGTYVLKLTLQHITYPATIYTILQTILLEGARLIAHNTQLLESCRNLPVVFNFVHIDKFKILWLS